MSANLDYSTGKAAIAYVGETPWHKEGTKMLPGMTIDQWAEAAGLAWHAVKVPAIVALEGPAFDHIDASKRFTPMPERSFLVRNDNGAPLSYVSDIYQAVQPRETLEWFDRYISVDDRFTMETAGALDGGKRIWALARFNGEQTIGGLAHKSFLLMSTTFDLSGATINQGTTVCVVCQNTLSAATADSRSVVRTSHRMRFDGRAVADQLAGIAQGFATYKAMGDALAQVELSRDDVSKFLRDMLDIPAEAKREEISTRKWNQRQAIIDALKTSCGERGTTLEHVDAFAALQAITRYVDHDRGSPLTRFENAQFGSGADMKAKAMGLLMPRIADKVPVTA